MTELKSEPHKGYKIVADIDSRHKILGQLESAKSLSQGGNLLKQLVFFY